MAVVFQIIKRIKKGGTMSAASAALLGMCFLFLMQSDTTFAASAPNLLGSEWRTGEIELTYTGVEQGNLVTFYAAKWDDPENYKLYDIWVDDGSGKHIVKFLENGQTHWFYITQVHPIDGVESSPSNKQKQTPPITAYIINWPDMMQDLQSALDGLKDAINDANQKLMDKMEELAKPSQGAQDNLKDAVNDMKDAIGAGSANQAGGALQGSFDDVANNGNSPLPKDDGVGTWTGGASPDVLPPLEGTMNEGSFCVTITKKMDGSDFRVCLFTDEQMEKMKWWRVIYDLLAVVPWVFLLVWVVQRFTPQFKV